MFISFAVVCAGVSGALVAWLVVRLVMVWIAACIGQANTGQPRLFSAEQNRPSTRGWRLCWPWISRLSAVCGPLLSWRQRDLLRHWAQQANLPTLVTPAHMVAVMVGVATLGAGAGPALAAVLGWHHAWAWMSLVSALLTTFFLLMQFRARVCRRRNRIDRELPFVLDMITLCVESGLSLHGALQQAVQHGPSGPLRDELSHALSTMRAGAPRITALKVLADRVDSPAVRQWVSALIQADNLGTSIGLLLREHAAQCRADRFQRAEKLAMQAPVKMLVPLIGCIFPCTFIVLAFPIVMQILEAGQ